MKIHPEVKKNVAGKRP